MTHRQRDIFMSVIGGNKDKAPGALKKLVDHDQIPVDYGGSNISLQEAAQREANDPLLKRQEIKLLHVNKKSTTRLDCEWNIGPEEELKKITCYTRSSTSAAVVV